MHYEVRDDRYYVLDARRVEAINEDADGEVYVAIFTGPGAEARAREYADWKTMTR